jgi:hypothetical protein
MSRARNPWAALGLGAWRLGLDSAAVIGLRSLKIAAGGSAGAAEVRRMVTEKIDAALALQALALKGGLGATPQRAAAKTLAHYRRRVQANHRRLSKG